MEDSERLRGISTLFFDLDCTLYPISSGVSLHTKQRIYLYVKERLGLEEHLIPELTQRYYDKYGLTLRGLIEEHGVDREDYLAFVDGGLPLEDLISPDPELRAMIEAIPKRYNKVIFTNSDRRHTARVLSILGLEGLFDTVVDVYEMGFVCKPDPRAYATAMARAGVTDPSQCLFFDDHEVNLGAAQAAGWMTVWVGHEGRPSPKADLSIGDIKEMRSVLPTLFLK